MNREGGGADKEVEEDKHTEGQEKAEKADKEKTVPKAQQTPGWVLSLNTNHHQIRGPSKANLCSDWVKAESTHVCLNTYLQQILIYEKHGMLQKWCTQLKPILWHTHCKLNKNKTIWVYWGLCTKHGFLVTERVNFKSPPIFSFTILIKHRPKGTSHMLEKGTLSTPSSNNFLFFFTCYFFIRQHLLIKTINIFESLSSRNQTKPFSGHNITIALISKLKRPICHTHAQETLSDACLLGRQFVVW